jgi:hypothetical protein
VCVGQRARDCVCAGAEAVEMGSERKEEEDKNGGKAGRDELEIRNGPAKGARDIHGARLRGRKGKRGAAGGRGGGDCFEGPRVRWGRDSEGGGGREGKS